MTVAVYNDLSFEKSNRQSVMQFLKRTNKSDEDPYLPELQTWRIKPPAPESETAIRKRVTNYLEFLRSKYQHAVDNGVQTANNWYPSPLRMDYGGGVRMAYSTEIGNWYKCFYDSAQATTGYLLISNPLQDMTLKSGVSRSEENLDCVEQLLDKIRD